jgi:UDP-glucose 4-epimerase
MPYVAKVATGELPHINVFGDDYDTPDGTGCRDYIHVVDLARGHLKALDLFNKKCGWVVYNLGAGRAYSVLEMIRAFEKASGKKLEYAIKPKREGDAAIVYADPAKAKKELGFAAEFGIDEMCRDAWRWISGEK